MEKEVFEENEITALFEDVSDGSQIAQTLVSFSNVQGGRVVFGVNAKSKVIGCNPSQVVDDLNIVTKMFCKDVIISEPTSRVVQNKFILETKVVSSEVSAKVINLGSENGYYIRSGTKNIKAGKILSQFFRLKSNTERIQLNPAMIDEELLALIKNGSNWTLAQLYKTSIRSKSEIDHMLPILLLNELVAFKIVDSVTYFY